MFMKILHIIYFNQFSLAKNKIAGKYQFKILYNLFFDSFKKNRQKLKALSKIYPENKITIRLIINYKRK